VSLPAPEIAAGGVTGEIREQHSHLPPFADRIGRCRRGWRLFSRILGGAGARNAQQGDRVEQLAAITDQTNAELLQVFSAEPWQNVGLYGIGAKRLLVLIQAKAPQPNR
jgi:hypothetical protein